MKFAHMKKKKYKMKKTPIILSLILGISIIVLLIYTFRSTSTGGEPISSELPSSVPVSSEPPSSVPVSSEPPSSVPVSSDEPPSSVPVSSDEPPSSVPVSSEPPSSVPVSSEPPSSMPVSSELPLTPTGELPAGNLSDWNLILLNPSADNKISKDLNIQTTKFDTQYVDSRAANAYQEMYNDAKKEGITLYLRSGYRSMKTQEINYNANIKKLMGRGQSREEATAETNLYYTIPGHSEHHTGLAFDIITPEYHRDVYTLNDQFASTDAYKWLLANCAEYGFILRYSKEKKPITTINFEPWHYRYVGIEHAKYIMDNDICFEEYIELLREAGR